MFTTGTALFGDGSLLLYAAVSKLGHQISNSCMYVILMVVVMVVANIQRYDAGQESNPEGSGTDAAAEGIASEAEGCLAAESAAAQGQGSVPANRDDEDLPMSKLVMKDKEVIQKDKELIQQQKELIQKQKDALQQSQQLHKDEVQRLHKSLQAAKKDLEASKADKEAADAGHQVAVDRMLKQHESRSKQIAAAETERLIAHQDESGR